MNQDNPYPELPDALIDCLRRTIRHCREALDEPESKFKASVAKLWLKNLDGWVPEPTITEQPGA